MGREPFCLNFGATKYEEKYEVKKPLKDLFSKSNLDYKMRFYTAKHIESGEICSVKEVSCKKENYIDSVWKEVETVIKLRDHKFKNLIKYYEAFLYDFVDPESGIEMQGVKIVMELVDYPLSDMVQQGLEENDAYEKLKETLNAMQNLKSFGIQHRDIKPSNLVVQDGVLKIIALDACKLTDKFETQTITDKIGTKIYMDPCLNNMDYDDGKLKSNIEKSGLYSLGLIFLQLCRRMGAVEYQQFQQKVTFYYCNNQMNQYQQLIDKKLNQIQQLELKEILYNLLRFVAMDRWDLNKCLQEVELQQMEIIIKSKQDYENFVSKFEQMEEKKKFIQSFSVEFGVVEDSYQASVYQKIQEQYLNKIQKLKIVYVQKPDLESLNQSLDNLKYLRKLELNFERTLIGDQLDNLIQLIKNIPLVSHLHLDLFDNQIGIGENKTIQLADSLKCLQNLSHLHLDLYYNQIGDDGASKLAYGLKSLVNLSHLELHLQENPIEDNGTAKLADSLKSLQNLSHLHLDLIESQIGDYGASQLADGLKHLQNLLHLHLDLYENQIGDNGTSKLADGLKSIQNLSRLHLDLKCNKIGDSGASKLADGLKSLPNLDHLQLNLQNNQLGLDMKKEIFEKLHKFELFLDE